MHKRNFSLTTGACLNDDNYSIIAFEVRVEDGEISVLLPEPKELDQAIATSKWMVKRDTARTLDSGTSPEDSVIDIVGAKSEKIAGCESACGDTKLEW